MLSQAIAINIPSTLTLTVTHEQFVELAQANRELQLERTATGELIVMPDGKVESQDEGIYRKWMSFGLVARSQTQKGRNLSARSRCRSAG